MTLQVLHVYSGNLYGGVETLLATLARYRDACPDMEPHFALAFEGRLSDELRTAGAAVTILGDVRISRPSSVIRARRALAALLASQRVDVAVCHSTWPQAIFGGVIRSARVPLAFYMHNWTEGRHWLERAAKLFRPDLVIVNSQYTAESVPRMYPGVPAEVFYSPHAPVAKPTAEHRTFVRRELDSPPDAVVIMQASRMEPWKGQRLHLEALARLNHLPDWVCWHAGGAQRPHERKHLAAMRALAEELGIASRVRFLGQRSDVPSLLAAADIHCQPNLMPESFGSAFIEAMFAGLPVVTTAIGGANELVDATCGVRVPPGNVEELANALSHLLQDSTRRRELGDGARRRAEMLCDLERQMRGFHDLLARVAGRTAPAHHPARVAPAAR